MNMLLRARGAEVARRAPSMATVPGSDLEQAEGDHRPRPRVEGKFLSVGRSRLFLRGVTYGTFRPAADGSQFPDPAALERDFAAMALAGVNAVRTYTPPPSWALDAAHRHGLWVLVGLPWEEHVDFLAEPRQARAIEGRVRGAVRACAGHPAVLGYVIGNEIPAPIVRWVGRRRVEQFLRRLYLGAKEEDPGGLATYANYPSTEYLELPFLDFVCFNLYLEAPAAFAAYLQRLHVLAGDRPLILSEAGLDSRRNGLARQARVVDWQVRTAFARGLAGAFVFSWTDEWYRGDTEVVDWDFGLVDRERLAKPALPATAEAFAAVPFPPTMAWPRVSVVVCSYNGSRTIRECLEALTQLEYPNYEVIVVDDGSTDDTATVASGYDCRLIRTPNHGLSSARNSGLATADGEIVAYVDDDAYADPLWLQYLAATFMRADVVGVGGPNIPPPGDGPVAECVANAPGGPIHVLLDDEIAEHLPGCNMAFRREALEAIGGFDPQFRAAGDDVDVCWRLQGEGWRLGFCPAAVVWHHRRASVRGYWKQQVGYGRAEAMLERKWPEKYNRAGHARWTGRLYGRGVARSLWLAPGRVYQGLWGMAPFQSLYQPAPNSVASLPLLPEWYLALAVLACVSALGALWPPFLLATPLLVLGLGTVCAQSVASAARATFAEIQPAHLIRLRWRALVALLHLLQPLARLRGRLGEGLAPWRPHDAPEMRLPRRRTFTTWTERWEAPVERLIAVEAALRLGGAPARRGAAFDTWDLELRAGLFGRARILVAIEEHGAGRQLVRIRAWPCWSWYGLVLALVGSGLAILAWQNGVLLAAAGLGAGTSLLIVRTFEDSGAAVGRIVRAVRTCQETWS